jgi:hypothetical protein
MGFKPTETIGGFLCKIKGTTQKDRFQQRIAL